MEQYEVLRIVFMFCISALIITGFYLSAKLTGAIPEPIRLVILSPSLAGIGYAIGLLQFNYVPYWPDVFCIVSMMLISAFVASLFGSRPWIDFNKHNQANP
jgi:hypothetical protein